MDKFPEKDYKKMTFSFSREELEQLRSLSTMIQSAQIQFMNYQEVTDKYCKIIAKKRGVKDSVDVGLEYSVAGGNLYAYVPKNWCITCGIRKATYNQQGKFYCTECIKVEVPKVKK